MQTPERDISRLTQLARALSMSHTRQVKWNPVTREYDDVYEFGREWHRREQNRGILHPAVTAAFRMGDPLDWHEVVLQWPHVSATDPTKLAYTQDEAKGIADRQTITSVGKYLARHWKCLPDHVIRGLAERFTATGVEIRGTMEEIVQACQEGPASCMRWGEYDIRHDGQGHHPYEVYAPSMGWSIAVRMEAGSIKSRALVYEYGGQKCFVRTYMTSGEGYSQRDTPMEAWLEEKGYSHLRAWPNGAQLAKIFTGRGDADHLLPYLDGETQSVTQYRDHWEITDDGAEFQCDNTDGTAESQNQYQCGDCGDRFRTDEDFSSVGYHGDHQVCGSCLNDGYSYATGRRGNEYYVPNDDAVEVDGEYYHDQYLSDNDIVELENGGYTHIDNAFCCAESGDWYHTDEGVSTEDNGMCHIDSAWECEESNNWYSNSTDSVTDSEGRTIHPDYLPEETDAE